MRIHINQLLFPEPVVAGMNPYVFMSMAFRYRSTNDDLDPIIVSNPCGIIHPSRGVLWEIVDGRHRALAAMIAGRKEILAEEELS
jgi:hypothetical protein